MASIINRPDGHRWIQFVDADGKRQTVRLGKTPTKAAATVCTRVEELLAVKMTGGTVERDLAGWLASIDATLQNKLAAVGLCHSRESALLQPFITSYVESRTDVKTATKGFGNKVNGGWSNSSALTSPCGKLRPAMPTATSNI
jgi:hypothetical protein